VNIDRYDDRDLVRTNLIDTYDRILAFVKKHLPDPFYLEGIERRSLRDAIFRMISVPEFGAKAQIPAETGQVKAHDEAYDEAYDKAHDLSDTERQILIACTEAAQSTPELLNKLGYKSRTGNFKKALSHLVDELAALERTLPDAVRSKNQKYRLISKGRKLLETIS
jgi:ATP-dependent DNA helicase RecG